MARSNADRQRDYRQRERLKAIHGELASYKLRLWIKRLFRLEKRMKEIEDGIKGVLDS